MAAAKKATAITDLAGLVIVTTLRVYLMPRCANHGADLAEFVEDDRDSRLRSRGHPRRPGALELLLSDGLLQLGDGALDERAFPGSRANPVSSHDRAQSRPGRWQQGVGTCGGHRVLRAERSPPED